MPTGLPPLPGGITQLMMAFIEIASYRSKLSYRAWDLAICRVPPVFPLMRTEHILLVLVNRCFVVYSTWSGPAWSPALSLSSLLMSIQSLMNEKPYHNEPGFEQVIKIVTDAYHVLFVEVCFILWDYFKVLFCKWESMQCNMKLLFTRNGRLIVNKYKHYIRIT